MINSLSRLRRLRSSIIAKAKIIASPWFGDQASGPSERRDGLEKHVVTGKNHRNGAHPRRHPSLRKPRINSAATAPDISPGGPDFIQVSDVADFRFDLEAMLAAMSLDLSNSIDGLDWNGPPQGAVPTAPRFIASGLAEAIRKLDRRSMHAPRDPQS